MKKFTVLLLYPDYATGNFGQDTYQAWVEASTVQEAKELAQLEAVQREGRADDEELDDPDDYFVLAVYEGHLEDIKDRIDPPFKCKYCGLPSFYPPEDQTPPPDYCHESDHGSAESH